jgi:hypothetical protein
MDSKNLISIQEICTHYNVTTSFISALKNYELIEIVVVEKNQCIHLNQIKRLEKIIRLYYELEINFEGMQAISNLLNKVESLQNEINKLNNKLDFYKGD